MKRSRSTLALAPMPRSHPVKTISRRAFLGSIAVTALPIVLGIHPVQAAIASQGSRSSLDTTDYLHWSYAELHAFRAPACERWVVALSVTQPASPQQGELIAPSDVTFHLNGERWSIPMEAATSRSTVAAHDAPRTFAGVVTSQDSGISRSPMYAIVLELSGTTSTAHANRELGLWAQIGFATGHTIRIGNPFVSRLTRGNAALCALRADQAQALNGNEAPVASSDFSRRLTDRASLLAFETSGMRDTRHASELHSAHVMRLATPDVLRVSLDEPVGFTFAAQNGRHPADDVSAVVDTLLLGHLTPAEPRAVPTLRAAFPYFEPAQSAV